MKTFAVMLFILLAGDFGLFSGAYTRHVWRETREQLHSFQSYADNRASRLTGG